MKKHLPAFLTLSILIVFPFAVALVTGESIGAGAPRFWQGMLIQVFIYAIYALSYDLLFGYTGVLSFGHAMFFGTGAYATGMLLKHAKLDLATTLVIVIVIAVAQSLVVGFLSLRVKGVYFAMVTLAFAQLFFILSEATDFRQWTGAEDGLHGIPVPAFISPTEERLRFYYIALAFCLIVYLVVRRIVDSPTGRVMIAVRENEARAQTIGYNTFAYKLVALCIAGICAALAGALHLLFNLSATSNLLGADTTINALLMTIIGGAGTLSGPMLGAGVYQLLGYWLNTQFGPRWPLILGVVFVFLVLFLPYGIVGTWRARSVRLTQGWRELWARFKLD
jgi:branched-chain amino acid transport system permease protein